MPAQSVNAEHAVIEETVGQENADGSAQDGAASLAAYKTQTAEKGIPTFEEPVQKPKAGSRGRTKKMITKIEELDEIPTPDQPPDLENIPKAPKKPVKKSTKKPMAKKISQSAEEKKESSSKTIISKPPP